MRMKKLSKPPELKELDDRIALVKADMESAVEAQDFTRAQDLKGQVAQLTKERREKEDAWRSDEGEFYGVIGEEEVAEVLAAWTGIPVYRLTEEESAKLLRMEEELHKAYISQDDAVKAVSRAIRRTRAGLKDPKRPSGSFIFLGPSGVGKTKLAKQLAEFLFGDEDALIQIDMSEYMEKHTVSRLVGSPPGYVGYDEGGQLSEAVRRRPYSVVLFDEIEKAHYDVFNVLLQILEDGRLTDAQGHQVDFKNTVIIMTSNLGTADVAKAKGIGFSTDQTDDIPYEKMKDKVLSELKKSFRPELLNRIDEIIVFHPLSREQVKSIVDLEIKRPQEQLLSRGMGLELTEAAKDLLAEKGYDPALGARPLRRMIQRMVEDPLSEKVLWKEFRPGQTVVVDAKDGEIIFTSHEDGSLELPEPVEVGKPGGASE
jgi:ATP-dependent Clp protease ATP-binding subunit ClpC